MYSYPTLEARSTRPQRPSAVWPPPQAELRVRRLRLALRPRQLRQLDLLAQGGLAAAPLLADDCHVRDGHGGGCGRAATAAETPGSRQHPPRAGIPEVPLRRAEIRTQAAGSSSLPNRTARETSVAKARDCLVLAFLSAACAACRGRGSIYACCTCNTLP